MAKNSTYDSVKQSLPNTTSRSTKGNAGSYGQNKKPASVVETSTTADKPIFYSSKNT